MTRTKARRAAPIGPSLTTAAAIIAACTTLSACAAKATSTSLPDSALEAI
jgi:hypothetical protein